jgi:ribonuclease P protein component
VTPGHIPATSHATSVNSCDQRFTKQHRLLKPADFRAVFANARWKSACEHFVLLAIPSATGSRLGLVIAKKHVKRATDRNRLKRVSRECFRQRAAASPALDVVLVARRGMDTLDNPALSSILQRQWQRLEQRAARDTRKPDDPGEPCGNC